MEALDRALVNVYSLSIVTIPLIQFGRNAPCKRHASLFSEHRYVSVGGRRRYRWIGR